MARNTAIFMECRVFIDEIDFIDNFSDKFDKITYIKLV